MNLGYSAALALAAPVAWPAAADDAATLPRPLPLPENRGVEPLLACPADEVLLCGGGGGAPPPLRRPVGAVLVGRSLYSRT
jgi:hypothetical protein